MAENDELYDENGRSYHKYQRGLYWLPHDDHEMERLDIFHGLLYNDDKMNLPLHRCPLSPSAGEPPRILDVGCGTGFWAMDMAERYLDAEVVGIDLVNIQPRFVPRNVTFLPHKSFNDRHWPFAEEHFDLIHLSMINACVVDWNQLYNTTFRHLRAGSGHIEHLEFDLAPTHIGGNLAPDSLIFRWYKDLVESADEAQRPIKYDPDETYRNLRRAGFVDIQYERHPIPWHYYGREGENYKIGGTFSVTMVHGMGFEAFCMAPFSRVRQWTRPQIEGYIELVKKELRDTQVQLQSYIYVWTARKP